MVSTGACQVPSPSSTLGIIANLDIAQLGRALGLGPRGRWFESSYLESILITYLYVVIDISNYLF